MSSQHLHRPSHEIDPGLEPAAPAGTPGKSSLTSRLAAPSVVLRVADPETARALGEALRGGRVQRTASAQGGARDANGVAADAEHAVAEAQGSSGAPLRADLRERFEASLGADLSAVRVHTGDTSAAASAAVGARAYTVGNDIHFAAGQYQPEDPFGMHLIAHEVAHTVQQAGGAARRQHKLEVSTPGDAAEVEADRAADAMVRGEEAAVGGAGGAIARDADGAAAAARGHAATPDGDKKSAALTQTSITFTQGGVSGTIDWSKGVTGSVAYKIEEDIKKFPAFNKQIRLAAYKEVVGLLLELNSEAGLKYGGELTAGGSFEEGKGGTVTLGGGGFVEGSVSGKAKLAGYTGVVDVANLNAGFAGKIEAKASAAVKVTQPVLQLGPDGKASGAAVIDGDVTVEQNATWGSELGWYADKKSGTLVSLELGREPLGKLHNIGFTLTLNADGTTALTWKWPPKFEEPPMVAMLEGRVIPNAQQKVAGVVDQAKQEAELQQARDALAPDPEMCSDEAGADGGMSEDPSVGGGTSG